MELWQSYQKDGVSKFKFINHRQHNFQLQYYIMTGDIKGSWRPENPKKSYGLDLNNPNSLRNYNHKFNDAGDYGSFLAFEFGFDKFFGEIVGRYIIMPFFLRNYDS